MSNEAIVTIPPEVVRTLASSTVFVKASSLVNLDFTGMVAELGTRNYILMLGALRIAAALGRGR